MSFYGRVEKRVPVTVPIYITVRGASNPAERTLTENVNPHGVRVMTRQPIRTGERPIVCVLSNECESRGRIVYCQPLPNARYCVGMEFPESSVIWSRSITLIPD